MKNKNKNKNTFKFETKKQTKKNQFIKSLNKKIKKTFSKIKNKHVTFERIDKKTNQKYYVEYNILESTLRLIFIIFIFSIIPYITIKSINYYSENDFNKFFENLNILNNDIEDEFNISSNQTTYIPKTIYEEVQPAHIFPIAEQKIHGELIFFSKYDLRHIKFNKLTCETCDNLELYLINRDDGTRTQIFESIYEKESYVIAQNINLKQYNKLIMLNENIEIALVILN